MHIFEVTLGALIKKRRKEMGYSHKDVAELLGYKNTTKGIRKIERLEKGGRVKVVLERVMEIFGITEEERAACLAVDEKRDYEWKVKHPIKPHLVVRVVPAVYLKQEVPEGGTEKELLEYAKGVAMERNWKCWLILSHWVRYVVEGDGRCRLEEDMGGGPRSMLGDALGVVLKE